MHKRNKESLSNFSLLDRLFHYPQGLDCVTFSYAIVYSILTFPLNPPLAKGDFARVLAPLRGYKKRKTFRSSLSSTPSGARTLDPNIKSVVLYQLS